MPTRSARAFEQSKDERLATTASNLDSLRNGADNLLGISVPSSISLK